MAAGSRAANNMRERTVDHTWQPKRSDREKSKRNVRRLEINDTETPACMQNLLIAVAERGQIPGSGVARFLLCYSIHAKC